MPTSRHASSAIWGNTNPIGSHAPRSPHSSCSRWRRSLGRSNTWALRSVLSSPHRCVWPRHRWKFGFKIDVRRQNVCRKRKSRKSKWPPWAVGRPVHSGPWPVIFIRVWCIWDKWRPGWCALTNSCPNTHTHTHSIKHNQKAYEATPLSPLSSSIVVTRKQNTWKKNPKILLWCKAHFNLRYFQMLFQNALCKYCKRGRIGEKERVDQRR